MGWLGRRIGCAHRGWPAASPCSRASSRSSRWAGCSPRAIWSRFRTCGPARAASCISPTGSPGRSRRTRPAGLGEAVIPGVTGWICREASPRALAEVLHEAGAAGRAELRRMGEEGRRWAERAFDWDTIARATEAVYRRALTRREPGRAHRDRPNHDHRRRDSTRGGGGTSSPARIASGAPTGEVVDLLRAQPGSLEHRPESGRAPLGVVAVGRDRVHEARPPAASTPASERGGRQRSVSEPTSRQHSAPDCDQLGHQRVVALEHRRALGMREHDSVSAARRTRRSALSAPEAAEVHGSSSEQVRSATEGEQVELGVGQLPRARQRDLRPGPHADLDAGAAQRAVDRGGLVHDHGRRHPGVVAVHVRRGDQRPGAVPLGDAAQRDRLLERCAAHRRRRAGCGSAGRPRRQGYRAMRSSLQWPRR